MKRPIKKSILICYMFLITGCSTTYIYPSIEPKANIDAALSDIVVAVEKTENIDYGWGGEPTAPSDLHSLVLALKKKKLFKEIGYVSEISNEPDLVLSHYRDSNSEFRGLHGEKGGFLCNIYLSALTLFTIPMYCDIKERVKFIISTADKNNSKEIVFTRNNRNMFGLFAGLTLLSPNWSKEDVKIPSSDYTKNYNDYAINKVIENQNVFIQLLNK